MERKFEFDKKDSYSHEDVTQLLEQNKTFVSGGFKGFIAPEDLETKAAELTAAKTKKASEDKKTADARTALITSLIPSDVTEKKFKSNLVTLANISEDDDSDTISTKLKDTLKSNPHLTKSATFLEKVVVGKEVLTEEQKAEQIKKDSKFANL